VLHPAHRSIDCPLPEEAPLPSTPTRSPEPKDWKPAATRARRAGGPALCILLSLGLSLGCAGRLSGVVDFDADVDFEAKRTLAFYEDAFPLERKQTEVRQLIRAAIEQDLRGRGFGFGRAGEADLLIVYHVGNRAKMHFGGTMRSTEREASLSIVFQDPVTRRSVWYGTVEQTWAGDADVSERVDTAVTTLLAKFPPEPGESGEQRVRE
jgi:hypothetical protein